jgi:hypothetical protein
MLKISTLKYGSIVLATTSIIILSIMAITSNFNSYQNALAQQQQQQQQNSTKTNTTNTTSGNQIDTFRAKGQISSVASDFLAGRTNSNNSQMWVLGGDWEFNVANGTLTNFVTDIVMTQINGQGAHRHTIEKLNDVSGMNVNEPASSMTNMMKTNTHQKVALQGNSTMFRGTADITTNGKIKWTKVPVHVALLNGNIININIDPTKTNDHFKGLPVYGTVQFIIDKDGKDLIKPQQP